MEKIGHVYRVRPGRADEYEERHATIPAELDALLRAAGVRSYTIYLWGDLVFTHMEVDSFERMVERYNGDPIAERWEALMGELIEYPGADPVSGWPETLRMVWDL